MNDAPNPDLLAEYGTDEVYLAMLESRAYKGPESLLEKRADDTIFGAPTAGMSRSEWAWLMAAHGARQQTISRQRAQAAVINQQLRHLEGRRMANAVENLGGAGTTRSRYTRALQTQPYMLHPLMMAGGFGGGGGMMSPEAMGSMGMPMGAGVDSSMPMDDMPDLHDVTASIMSHILTKQAAPYAPSMVGEEYYGGVGQMPPAVRGLGAPQWNYQQSAGPPKEGLGTKAKKAIKAVSSGLLNWMSQDVQPTTRWGTGLTPASDVNQFGQPVW